MPTPTQVGSKTTQVNSTANTTANPSIPTGLTNGQHWMILSGEIFGNKTGSINTPTGWTAVTGSPFLNSASTGTLFIYYKKFATGDTAPSVTWTTNNKNASGIVAYKDCDLTTLLDAVVASGTGSSTTPTSPTATAVTRGATRLHIHGIVINGGGTPSFDMTEQLDAATSATSPAAVYLSDQPGMAEGALGTRTATTTTASWVGVTLWLRPATATSFGLLQSAIRTQNSNTPSIALPNNGTSGSLLTASIFGSNAARGISGVSYGGGSFVQTQSPVGARVYIVGQFYFANNTSTSTITTTATLTGSANNSSLLVCEWLGADTSSPLDAVGAADTVGTSAVSVTTSGAASSGAILALMVVGSDDASSFTVGTGYLLRWAQTSVSIAAGGVESQETTGGSTITATATTGNTVNGWNAQIACFKVAVSGGTVAATALARGGARAQSSAARPLVAAGRPGPRPAGLARGTSSAQGPAAARALALGRGAITGRALTGPQNSSTGRGAGMARSAAVPRPTGAARVPLSSLAVVAPRPTGSVRPVSSGAAPPRPRALSSPSPATTARADPLPRTLSAAGRPLTARGVVPGTARGTLTATAVAQLTARALAGALGRGLLGRAATGRAPGGARGQGLLTATAVVQAVARGVTGALGRAQGRSLATARSTGALPRSAGLLVPRAPGGTARGVGTARSSPAPAITARAAPLVHATSTMGGFWQAVAAPLGRALGAVQQQWQALASAQSGGTALLDVLGALNAFIESTRIYHLPAVPHLFRLPAVVHQAVLAAARHLYVLPGVAHLFRLPQVPHQFVLPKETTMSEALIYVDPQKKATADILPYGVDATAWLGTAHLAAVVTSLSGRDVALTKGGTGRPTDPQIDGTQTKVTQWLSGGTPGHTYLLHFDLTDDSAPARQIRASIQIDVR